MYATQDSLIKRYTADVLLSVAMTKERTLDEAKVQEALEDASQTIDSYLAGRYALPLKQIPAVLERHCCYIARYFLEKNRATNQSRQDYEDSIRYLEKVAAGSISLGISEQGETVESDNTAMIESAGSVWARDKSKGFI
ncbi:Mu-like prophage protein GP36 [Canicola haemoglobinophilus]|uniref:Mu-like prophage protein GP36 n=1 Tax=Canicola haemoglobinophilus TaxID=733 RepID=A0AB38HCS4_9PAST|nr:phage protein Gp36 family protein [Canicola haemoglobinophilus]STO55360.1 Mu-like prophage protein GP36 [Canicola haemoglobinophilus]STO69071.1 Mu-like prophage protein GP36 [Canicola haemoglobinophilus]